MKRLLPLFVMAGLSAAPVQAEPEVTKGLDGQDCMSADLGIIPARLTYDNGASQALLGQSRKVLVWASTSDKGERFKIRNKYGLFPLEVGSVVYDWTSALPDAYAIEASGETFRGVGTYTVKGREPAPYEMHVTVLGRDSVAFNGCPYEVMQLEIVHWFDGKPGNRVLMSYDPELWISFRTEVEQADGSVTVRFPVGITTFR